ncbi:MAG TPA: hypothetical protein PLL78_10740 [Fimbriimonadaceae bacterium]|nr:hypothetical protein [Fimbriimonadaceae bacterium]HRJ97152.1 hypothetical protein [Fimbriimonadaceae bacterium]
MQEFIDQLVAKVGLDKETAAKVVAFVQEHAADIPKWIGQSGFADKLPGGIGDALSGLMGGDDK